MKILNIPGNKNVRLLILMPLLIISCAPAYVPNMVNSPLFSNKNEFTANLGGGTNGFDVQLAFAASDHFALMINSSFSSQTGESADGSYNDDIYHKHKFFEGGVGYFDSPNDWLNFEIFGGYGAGSVSSYDDFWTDSISGNYGRLFIQPSMGIVSDFIDISLTPRVTYVNFEGNLKYSNQAVSGTGVFLEPTVMVKLGFKQVKFFGQLGWSFKINSSDYDFEYQPLIFGIGAQLTLGRKKEKSFMD